MMTIHEKTDMCDKLLLIFKFLYIFTDHVSCC